MTRGGSSSGFDAQRYPRRVKRAAVWGIAALFIASGATWLAAIIWRTSTLTFAPAFGPHVVAALLTGLTLARALDRRAHAIALAVTGMVIWIGIEVAAFLLHGAMPRWSVTIASSTFAHFAVLAIVCVPVAAGAASLPLRGRPDHRLLWLWIAALLTLGTVVAPVTLMSTTQILPAIGAVFVIAAPMVAGAIAQVLAPFRAIWTCGGGALIFVLIVLDKSVRNREVDGILAPLMGMGIFILLGALGARIGWRLFRNNDPREPRRSPLPIASVQGDV